MTPAPQQQDIDRTIIDAVMDALQAAAQDVPVPAGNEALGELLARLGLLGPDGLHGSVDTPTLLALLQAMAAWRPDMACLQASDAMTQVAKLPPGHAVALHAWPQERFWRLARPAAVHSPLSWCWWWEGRILHARAEDFDDAGLSMQECSVRKASCLRTSLPGEQELLDGLRQALQRGIAQAALQATEAHVGTRQMFHRRMIDLPSIAWRLRHARALLASGRSSALRIELEQLQGGAGFMQESTGAQWLDWLYWANLLPAPAGRQACISSESSRHD